MKDRNNIIRSLSSRIAPSVAIITSTKLSLTDFHRQWTISLMWSSKFTLVLACNINIRSMNFVVQSTTTMTYFNMCQEVSCFLTTMYNDKFNTDRSSSILIRHFHWSTGKLKVFNIFTCWCEKLFNLAVSTPATRQNVLFFSETSMMA